MSGFVFAACQAGAEAALKAEVAREHPELRFAYSRPGLVTFKSSAAGADVSVAPDVELRSVFARAFGASLGAARDVAAAVALAAPFAPARLHVWDRDDTAAVHPSTSTGTTLAAAVRRELLAAGGATFLADPRPRRGDLVVDVIVAPDEASWVGCHRAGDTHSPWPGGLIAVDVPAEAPSRAYRKLEEALAWSRAPVRRGHVAVELGSAPGGASYALLRRGVHVVGVDPGAMDPMVLGYEGPGGARFQHLQTTMGDLRREQLPGRVDWLLLDVNLAPQVALHAVRRLVAPLRRTLRGVLFTLKLNDWAMAAEVPALLTRVESMGLKAVRATQLPSNRQEIFVHGQA